MKAFYFTQIAIDKCEWLLTPTALLRVHAKPVFLRPDHWPKDAWRMCACGASK